MANVTLQVPDDLVAKLKGERGNVGEELRLAAAFSLCSRGELSTSQAARLAGLTYAEFLEAAARAKFQLYPVQADDIQEEIARGFTLGCQRIPDHPAGEGRAP